MRIITLPSPQQYYALGDTGTVDQNDSNIPWVHIDNNLHGDGRWAVYEDCLELIEPQPDRMAELEARVVELERALAAKHEPRQGPEFLEGRREFFSLLENGCILNHPDGSGIYVSSGYEAVILPWPQNPGGSIIRFRRNNQAR